MECASGGRPGRRARRARSAARPRRARSAARPLRVRQHDVYIYIYILFVQQYVYICIYIYIYIHNNITLHSERTRADTLHLTTCYTRYGRADCSVCFRYKAREMRYAKPEAMQATRAGIVGTQVGASDSVAQC